MRSIHLAEVSSSLKLKNLDIFLPSESRCPKLEALVSDRGIEPASCSRSYCTARQLGEGLLYCAMLALALANMPASSMQRCAASGALASLLASGEAQSCTRSGVLVESSTDTRAKLSSPPRPGTQAGYLRGTLTPTYALTAAKTRRKRRRSGGAAGSDDDGGDGGDDGGDGNSGWFGPWGDDGEEDDDDSNSSQIVSDSLAAWRCCLFLMLIQTMHFLTLTAARPIGIGGLCLKSDRKGHAEGSSQFATLSAAFFARRISDPQLGVAS